MILVSLFFWLIFGFSECWFRCVCTTARVWQAVWAVRQWFLVLRLQPAWRFAIGAEECFWHCGCWSSLPGEQLQNYDSFMSFVSIVLVNLLSLRFGEFNLYHRFVFGHMCVLTMGYDVCVMYKRIWIFTHSVRIKIGLSFGLQLKYILMIVCTAFSYRIAFLHLLYRGWVQLHRWGI